MAINENRRSEGEWRARVFQRWREEGRRQERKADS
jgi:hypothetical protein